MTAPAFEALRAEYAGLWRQMQIDPAAARTVDLVARKLLGQKRRYQAVAAQTGVPWFVIAVLHERESSGDFQCHLHNGDSLKSRTHHVPAGRPPYGSGPYTWEESAVDALEMHGLHKIEEWPIERIAYECERYNGFGYRKRGVPSAYLWSFSNVYRGGKYVADGVWSAGAFDRQSGCMPLLARMSSLDASIRFAAAPAPTKDAPKPVPGVERLGWCAALAAGSAAAAHWLAGNAWLTAGALVIAALVALWAIERLRR